MTFSIYGTNIHTYVEIFRPKDGTSGTLDSNGTWTGLYGLMVGKQVDVILSAMTITETRNDIVDFMHPTQKTKYNILRQSTYLSHVLYSDTKFSTKEKKMYMTG